MKMFSDGCTDKCNYSLKARMCTMSFSSWCDCWKDKCWTWNECVQDIWSIKRKELMEKKVEKFIKYRDELIKKDNLIKKINEKKIRLLGE